MIVGAVERDKYSSLMERRHFDGNRLMADSLATDREAFLRPGFQQSKVPHLQSRIPLVPF